MTYKEETTRIDKGVMALCNLAQRLQEEGEYEEAEEKLTVVLESDPDNAFALVGLGDLKVKKKQFKEAAHYYQKCLLVEIDNESALIGLGDAYRELGEVDIALEIWLHYLSLSPADYKVMTRVADGFRKKEGFEIARKIAEKYYLMALERNPDDPYALSGLGYIYMRETDDEEALKFFEKLIHTADDPIIPLSSAGFIYLKRRNYEKAMDYFDKALAIDPQNSYAWHGKANCFRGMKDHSSAIKTWRIALNCGMEPRIALTRIGDAYLKLKDLKYAELNYRNALALGYDKYAYLGMARIHIRRNNRDKAFKILSMLAEKEPGDPRIASEFKAFAEKYPELISDIPTAVTVA